jgi:hypothetical protein
MRIRITPKNVTAILALRYTVVATAYLYNVNGMGLFSTRPAVGNVKLTGKCINYISHLVFLSTVIE